MTTPAVSMPMRPVYSSYPHAYPPFSVSSSAGTDSIQQQATIPSTTTPITSDMIPTERHFPTLPNHHSYGRPVTTKTTTAVDTQSVSSAGTACNSAVMTPYQPPVLPPYQHPVSSTHYNSSSMAQQHNDNHAYSTAPSSAPPAPLPSIFPQHQQSQVFHHPHHIHSPGPISTQQGNLNYPMPVHHLASYSVPHPPPPLPTQHRPHVTHTSHSKIEAYRQEDRQPQPSSARMMHHGPYPPLPTPTSAPVFGHHDSSGTNAPTTLPTNIPHHLPSIEITHDTGPVLPSLLPRRPSIPNVIERQPSPTPSTASSVSSSTHTSFAKLEIKQETSLETTDGAVSGGRRRRTSHSLIERRRREKINGKLSELRDLIPKFRALTKSSSTSSSSSSSGLQVHKLMVLEGAIDYILELEMRCGIRSKAEEPSTQNSTANAAEFSEDPGQNQPFDGDDSNSD